MENYIFNTTDEKIDTSELDEVIQFACKKMPDEKIIWRLLS